MAEYYPLLAKAIAGLPNSTPESRRGVYERARKALLAQLHNLEPPLAEADVARETDALDDAVARLEAELTVLNGHAGETPSPAATASAPAAKVPPRPPTPLPPAPPPARPGVTPRRQESPAAAQPALRPRTGTGAPTSAPGLGKQRPNVSEPIEPTLRALDEPRPAAEPTQGARQTMKAAPAAAPSVKIGEPGDPDLLDDVDGRLLADVPRPRPEGLRLYAPQPSREEGRSGVWLWVVGGVVAVVVAIVAVAAWTLRDRPDQLAHLKRPAEAQPQQTGKIVERIGGPKTEPVPAPPPAAATPKQIAATPAPSEAAAAKPAAAGQAIAVAQRAALLVEAPNEPNKVKTYIGTVVWRLENVSGGAGQAPGTAVHADIDIPGDKMKVAITLQKNLDASLAASHTITVVFSVQPDSQTGGIKQISVPQLRQDDAPTGDGLVGVPVPIMDNSFLIGLTRGSAETTNLELIKTRAWFDIPILLGNGKIAKLTFEKNTTGTRAIDEAIAAWQG